MCSRPPVGNREYQWKDKRTDKLRSIQNHFLIISGDLILTFTSFRLSCVGHCYFDTFTIKIWAVYKLPFRCILKCKGMNVIYSTLFYFFSNWAKRAAEDIAWSKILVLKTRNVRISQSAFSKRKWTWAGNFF